MTEPKLYGIMRPDGTARRVFGDLHYAREVSGPTERVVEVVAVEKERLECLLSTASEVARKLMSENESVTGIDAIDLSEALAALRSGR